MMKRLLEYFDMSVITTGLPYHYMGELAPLSQLQYNMVVAVYAATFIPKCQRQMMADYLMAELLDQGRI